MLYSFDVFASTASILSLLTIALDRHAAISDPIQYYYCWIRRHWALAILCIWICSACISFPAIAYWRHVRTLYQPHQCMFTDDIYYIVFSSLISFYIPLTVMIVIYIRIYMTALVQVNALKIGEKRDVKASDGTAMTLRIHRGGYRGVAGSSNNEKSSQLNVADGLAVSKHPRGQTALKVPHSCADEALKKTNTGSGFFASKQIAGVPYSTTDLRQLTRYPVAQRRFSCASKIDCDQERPQLSQLLKLTEDRKELDMVLDAGKERSSSLTDRDR
jgi:hypothetical protein